MRSFLFVPADSERKLARAWGGPADALVLDLEDSLLPDRKADARRILADWLKGRPADERTWIRINEPDSSALLEDLATIVPLHPSGIVLPKIRGPEDVRTVSDYLTMAEAVHGAVSGNIK